MIDFLTLGFQRNETFSSRHPPGCPITKCRIIKSVKGNPFACVVLRSSDEVEDALHLVKLLEDGTHEDGSAYTHSYVVKFRPWGDSRRRNGHHSHPVVDRSRRGSSLDTYQPHQHQECSLGRQRLQEVSTEVNENDKNKDQESMHEEFVAGTKILVWGTQAKQWSREWLLKDLSNEMARYEGGNDAIVDAYPYGSRWVVEVISEDLAMKLRKKLKYTRSWWVYGLYNGDETKKPSSIIADNEGQGQGQGHGVVPLEQLTLYERPKAAPDAKRPSSSSRDLHCMIFQRPPSSATGASDLYSFLNDHLDENGLFDIGEKPIVSVYKEHIDALETCWIIQVISEVAKSIISSLDDTIFQSSTLSFHSYTRLSFTQKRVDPANEGLDHYDRKEYTSPKDSGKVQNTERARGYQMDQRTPTNRMIADRPVRTPPMGTPSSRSDGEISEYESHIPANVETSSVANSRNTNKDTTKAVSFDTHTVKPVAMDVDPSIWSLDDKDSHATAYARVDTEVHSISPKKGEKPAALSRKGQIAHRIIQPRAEDEAEQAKEEDERNRLRKSLNQATKQLSQQKGRSQQLEKDKAELVEKERSAREELKAYKDTAVEKMVQLKAKARTVVSELRQKNISARRAFELHKETAAQELKRIKAKASSAAQETDEAKKVAATAVQEMEKAKAEEKHAVDTLAEHKRHTKEMLQAHKKSLKSVTQQMEAAKRDAASKSEELAAAKESLVQIHRDWQDQFVELEDANRELETLKGKLEKERAARRDMDRRYRNVTESLAMQTAELAQERLARKSLQQHPHFGMKN